MGVRVHFTFANLEPLTSFNCRTTICNQDPSTNYNLYLGLESNPYGTIGCLGTAGGPCAKTTTNCDFQSLVGGAFVATDDAYITSIGSDPNDKIYLGVAIEAPGANVMTANKGVNVTMRISRDVVFFGRTLQLS
jgi:hypothetical protein